MILTDVLKLFTPDELLMLIHCETLDDLKKCIERDTFNDFQKLVHRTNTTRLKHYKKTNSFIAALEKASIPIDLFCFIIGIVSFGAAGAWIGLATVGLALAAGIFGFKSHYQEKQNTCIKNGHELAFMHLKNDVLEYVITIQLERFPPTQRAALNRMHQFQNQRLSKCIEEPTNLIQPVLKGFSIGSLITMTFFGGITQSLVTLNIIAATSLIAGPIGIGIATLFAVGVGLYFGYKQYQSEKNQQCLNNEFKEMKQLCESKAQTYETLCTLRPPKSKPALTRTIGTQTHLPKTTHNKELSQTRVAPPSTRSSIRPSSAKVSMTVNTRACFTIFRTKDTTNTHQTDHDPHYLNHHR